MSPVLLTVAIATHNNEKTLSDCIRSFIDHIDNLPVEVICVDDHSLDNSVKIAKSFSKISTYKSEGYGIGCNRNTAIKEAKGTYIWFIDADDKLIGSIFNVELVKLLKHLNDIYVLGFLIDRGTSSSRVVNSSSKVFQIYDAHISSVFDENNFTSVCNKLYKLSIIRDNKIKFDDLISGEDALFNCKYFKYVNTIHTINKVAYVYDTYSATSSKKNWDKDRMEATVRMLDGMQTLKENNKLFSSSGISKVIIDAALGNEMNFFNKKALLTYKEYKNFCNNSTMQRIISYVKIPLKDIHYFIKYLIVKNSFLSYIFIKSKIKGWK